ncbi:MAG: hypothetical protein ACRDSI_10075 [Pseudonocardiaceae bacterium]
MRRSSEPEERAQFSVAELLARYGEPAPTAGRRRRRAPDDSGTGADTAAQPTIAQPAVAKPTTEPDRTARTDPGSVSLPTTDRASRHGSSQPDSSPSYLNGRGDRQWTPAVGTPGAVPPPVRAPAVGTPVVGQPSAFAGRRPLTAAVLSDDPATVQFPRVEPASPGRASWSGRLPGGGEPPAGLGNGALGDGGPGNGGPGNGGLGTATRAIPEQAIPEQKVNGRRVGEPAGQTRNAAEEPYDSGTGERDEPEHGSPVRDWAVMVAQIGIGVVGGAALWLICEWLWQRMPVVALVVALVVITGLVWVVRRVRRAEDLQTTVIAVLVGLFVTVSPAALLLVGGR